MLQFSVHISEAPVGYYGVYWFENNFPQRWEIPHFDGHKNVKDFALDQSQKMIGKIARSFFLLNHKPQHYTF